MASSNKKAEAKIASGIKSVSKNSVENIAVTSAISRAGVSKVTTPKVTTTTTNLTSKNINNWKQRVDRAISKDLLTSLKKSYNDVMQMSIITSTQDDNTLSHNLKGLSNVIDLSYQQLKTFIKSFDTDLTEYINTMEKAEKTTSEKVKTTTDAFSEVASKIASLKM